MQKLPRLSGRETIKILRKHGFTPIRQSGSHVILKKPTSQGSVAVVVPLHDELDKGTLLAIIRKAGLDKEDFLIR